MTNLMPGVSLVYGVQHTNEGETYKPQYVGTYLGDVKVPECGRYISVIRPIRFRRMDATAWMPIEESWSESLRLVDDVKEVQRCAEMPVPVLPLGFMFTEA